MKFRQTRVCHNCRRHKLGCDGKRPGCTQCIHTGRQCEGYPGLLFVQPSLIPQNQSCSKPRQKARARVSREPQYHKHYGKSLSLLRRALNLPSDSHQNEKIATMMCLALSEALFPVAPNSWFIHLRAISEVMRSCKPEAFSVGIPHKLFTGIRPLLILEAMASKKATFLASDEWKTIPFQHNGPSSMQGFLSQAAIIPEIMQKADLLNFETLEKDGIQRLIELSDIATRLEASAITFEIEPNAPAYWLSSQRSNAAGNGYPHLCFSDLNAANAFTHLWAFEIVCLSKITELQTAFPCLGNMGDSFGGDILIKLNMRRQRCVDLAINICQSMKYMVREEWMMYGPSCAAFPVRMAFDVLEMDEKGREILYNLGQSALKDIDHRFLPLIGTRVK
ncbi:hypothetical protein V2G26_012120 [Clonostachys chloroleuca]